MTFPWQLLVTEKPFKLLHVTAKPRGSNVLDLQYHCTWTRKQLVLVITFPLDNLKVVSDYAVVYLLNMRW